MQFQQPDMSVVNVIKLHSYTQVHLVFFKQIMEPKDV